MRQLILSSLILFMTLSIVVTGCKKDDSSGPGTGTSGGSGKSTTDLLTGGSTRKWKEVSETVNGHPNTIDPCDQDNRVIFAKSGNAVTMDFGTTKCNQTEPNSVGGTWTLSNNDKILTLNLTYMGIPVSEALEIMSISDAQMVTREIDQGDTTMTTLSVAN